MSSAFVSEYAEGTPSCQCQCKLRLSGARSRTRSDPDRVNRELESLVETLRSRSRVE